MKEQSAPYAPSIRTIAIFVAGEHGLHSAVVWGRARDSLSIQARHLTMYQAARVYGHSASRTGAMLNRDHSTVLSAVGKIERRLATYGSYRAFVSDLARRLALLEGDPPADPYVTHSLEQEREISLLRRKGWSVKGLARRTGRPPGEVAQMLGIDWDARS